MTSYHEKLYFSAFKTTEINANFILKMTKLKQMQLMVCKDKFEYLRISFDLGPSSTCIRN